MMLAIPDDLSGAHAHWLVKGENAVKDGAGSCHLKQRRSFHSIYNDDFEVEGKAMPEGGKELAPKESMSYVCSACIRSRP